MARVDSLLGIVVDQGATELRLGVDREPEMYRFGARQRLNVPKTSYQVLCDLLGELLSPSERENLRSAGRTEAWHKTANQARFRVVITLRQGPSAPEAKEAPAGQAADAPQGASFRLPDFDVVFVRAVGPSMPTRAARDASSTGDSVPRNAAPLAQAPKEPFPNEPAPSPKAPLPCAAPAPSAAEVRALKGSDLGPIQVTAGLRQLLAAAVEARASDIHLRDGDTPWFRQGGRLTRGMLGDAGAVELRALLGPLLSPRALAALARGRSYDGAFEVPGLSRFRLNVYATSEGLAAAIRALASRPPLLSELGLPVPLDSIVGLPHGLVIVSGPTGCGKSTTLAALAEQCLSDRGALVITLEDPIEYRLGTRTQRGLVRQREIGRDVRRFATGLRDALREDPDVLLVGEMRDRETIALALTAAETGHLVLASAHSRSSASTIERIIDSYPGERQAQVRTQLADSLRVVVAQRLVPNARGTGRVVALEVLRVTHGVAALIRDNRVEQIPNAIQSGRREGMLSLERSLADRVTAGEITLEQARAFANDQTTLASYLGSKTT